MRWAWSTVSRVPARQSAQDCIPGELELAGSETRGLALRIATRVAAEAAPVEVLASSTVKDLVIGSDMRFVERGMRWLKGVPGEWNLFAVQPAGAGPQ